jgi:hypothetical protein
MVLVIISLRLVQYPARLDLWCLLRLACLPKLVHIRFCSSHHESGMNLATVFALLLMKSTTIYVGRSSVFVRQPRIFVCRKSFTSHPLAKFQYTFFDAFGQNNNIPELPITPFPTLFTAPIYRPANNTVELTVSHFFYRDPKSRMQKPLDVYLGNLGPLRQRIYQTSPAGSSIDLFVVLATVSDVESL